MRVRFRKDIQLSVAALLVAVAIGLSGSHQQAGAERTDPELIPPDVTMPLMTPPHTIPPPYTPPPSQQAATTAQPQATQAGADANKKDPLAVIVTDKGTITVRLFRKFAPMTCDHFIALVGNGFYNGLTFHRREPGFVIQGGCPNGNGSGLYMDPATNKPKFVNLETNAALRHNAPGVVAMARFGRNPNSASCQFYITLAACPQLDSKYTIFGGVVSGMEVVKEIVIGDKIQSIKIQEQ